LAGIMDKNKGGQQQQQYKPDQLQGECNPEQKKGGGLMDKVKNKIPGGHGGSADQQQSECKPDQRMEGGGLMDKVKDKIPGGHGGGADQQRGECKPDQRRGD